MCFFYFVISRLYFIMALYNQAVCCQALWFQALYFQRLCISKMHFIPIDIIFPLPFILGLIWTLYSQSAQFLERVFEDFKCQYFQEFPGISTKHYYFRSIVSIDTKVFYPHNLLFPRPIFHRSRGQQSVFPKPFIVRGLYSQGFIFLLFLFTSSGM